MSSASQSFMLQLFSPVVPPDIYKIFSILTQTCHLAGRHCPRSLTCLLLALFYSNGSYGSLSGAMQASCARFCAFSCKHISRGPTWLPTCWWLRPGEAWPLGAPLGPRQSCLLGKVLPCVGLKSSQHKWLSSEVEGWLKVCAARKAKC